MLFVATALPLSAQERTDTIYTFRFVPGKDMFYVPWEGNDKELARLETCVAQFRARIITGEIPLLVDGYCSSQESEAANLAMSKIRSNRVKSELILRQRLTEACFITHNHSGGGDYVTVRIAVPKADATASQAEKDRIESERLAREREAASKEQEHTEAEHRATEQPARQSVAIAALQPARAKDGYTLSLRANLLRWATLTPDVGVEWRVNRHVGIAVNGSYTPWSWNDKNRRYALWEVSPEVRWYLGGEKRGYVGAMYKAGAFNYKFSNTGKMGDLMGSGIVGGYQLPVGRRLALDFSVGVGCLHADYDKYTVIDGVRVKRGKESKNWWGPINAGVTLVWKFY